MPSDSATHASTAGARNACASWWLRRTSQSVRNSWTASASSGIGALIGLSGGSAVGDLVGAAPNGPADVSAVPANFTGRKKSDHQSTKPFQRRSWCCALSPARTSEFEDVRWPLKRDAGTLLVR